MKQMDLQKFLAMTFLCLLWCGYSWWRHSSRKIVLERFLTFWCGIALYEVAIKWF